MTHTGSHVEDIRSATIEEVLNSRNVSLRQIGYVNVIANARTVGRRIVIRRTASLAGQSEPLSVSAE